MNKTDPRVVKTLRQIDGAFLENLREQDFQKITIDMLCQSAMINRSTFYKYYRDKSDLLQQFLDRVLGDFRRAMNSTEFILTPPAAADDTGYMDNFRRSAEFIYSNRTVYRILWKASMGRNIYAEMVEIIQNNVLADLRRCTDLPPETAPYQDLCAKLFASNMMTLIYWWLCNDDTITVDDVCRLMNSNLKNGLFPTFKSII